MMESKATQPKYWIKSPLHTFLDKTIMSLFENGSPKPSKLNQVDTITRVFSCTIYLLKLYSLSEINIFI